MEFIKNMSQESFDEIKKIVRLANKNIIMSSMNKEGIFTFVSQAFCELSGYSQEELLGKSLQMLHDSTMAEFIAEDLNESLTEGQFWRGEIKQLRKNGTFYWLHASIEPCFEKEQEVVGFDAVYEDISCQKELQSLQAVVQELSKSATMGEMISLIAHQWKQPLQTLSILIQKIPITKMLEGELTDTFIEKLTRDASLQLEYMSQTIDDFRDFLKPEKTKQSIEAKALLQKTEDFLGYMFKADDIVFKTEVPSDITLRIYLNDVLQVLINIIKNSRDAMIENKTKNRQIFVCLTHNNTHAIIEIQDNAGGIPQAILSSVFDRYFTTKKSDQGTGLGLYMSKKIIEEHCMGNIRVKNHQQGVLFTLELPLY